MNYFDLTDEQADKLMQFGLVNEDTITGDFPLNQEQMMVIRGSGFSDSIQDTTSPYNKLPELGNPSLDQMYNKAGQGVNNGLGATPEQMLGESGWTPQKQLDNPTLPNNATGFLDSNQSANPSMVSDTNRMTAKVGINSQVEKNQAQADNDQLMDLKASIDAKDINTGNKSQDFMTALSLQGIVDTQSYPMEVRQYALNKLRSRWGMSFDRIEPKWDENKTRVIGAKAKVKSPISQLGDTFLTAQANDFSDEKSMLENTFNRGMGLFGAGARGMGMIQSGGARSMKDESTMYETDEAEAIKDRQKVTIPTLEKTIGTLYKKEQEAQDPNLKSKLRQNRIELQKYLEQERSPSGMEAVAQFGSAGLDPTILADLGLFLKGGKELYQMAKTGKALDVTKDVIGGARGLTKEMPASGIDDLMPVDNFDGLKVAPMERAPIEPRETLQWDQPIGNGAMPEPTKIDFEPNPIGEANVSGVEIDIDDYDGEYPLADRGSWWGDADYKDRGGKLVLMSPDEYLDQVRPLDLTDDATIENVSDLADHVVDGRDLDPPVIYADGKEDGRHRALMSKKMGWDKIPVIDFRASDVGTAPVVKKSFPSKVDAMPEPKEVRMKPLSQVGRGDAPRVLTDAEMVAKNNPDKDFIKTTNQYGDQEPQLWKHGSDTDIKEFDPERSGDLTLNNRHGVLYNTTDDATALDYGRYAVSRNGDLEMHFDDFIQAMAKHDPEALEKFDKKIISDERYYAGDDDLDVVVTDELRREYLEKGYSDELSDIDRFFDEESGTSFYNMPEWARDVVDSKVEMNPSYIHGKKRGYTNYHGETINGANREHFEDLIEYEKNGYLTPEEMYENAEWDQDVIDENIFEIKKLALENKGIYEDDLTEFEGEMLENIEDYPEYTESIRELAEEYGYEVDETGDLIDKSLRNYDDPKYRKYTNERVDHLTNWIIENHPEVEIEDYELNDAISEWMDYNGYEPTLPDKSEVFEVDNVTDPILDDVDSAHNVIDLALIWDDKNRIRKEPKNFSAGFDEFGARSGKSTGSNPRGEKKKDQLKSLAEIGGKDTPRGKKTDDSIVSSTHPSNKLGKVNKNKTGNRPSSIGDKFKSNQVGMVADPSSKKFDMPEQDFDVSKSNVVDADVQENLNPVGKSIADVGTKLSKKDDTTSKSIGNFLQGIGVGVSELEQYGLRGLADAIRKGGYRAFVEAPEKQKDLLRELIFNKASTEKIINELGAREGQIPKEFADEILGGFVSPKGGATGQNKVKQDKMWVGSKARDIEAEALGNEQYRTPSQELSSWISDFIKPRDVKTGEPMQIPVEQLDLYKSIAQEEIKQVLSTEALTKIFAHSEKGKMSYADILDTIRSIDNSIDFNAPSKDAIRKVLDLRKGLNNMIMGATKKKIQLGELDGFFGDGVDGEQLYDRLRKSLASSTELKNDFMKYTKNKGKTSGLSDFEIDEMADKVSNAFGKITSKRGQAGSSLENNTGYKILQRIDEKQGTDFAPKMKVIWELYTNPQVEVTKIKGQNALSGYRLPPRAQEDVWSQAEYFGRGSLPDHITRAWKRFKSGLLDWSQPRSDIGATQQNKMIVDLVADLVGKVPTTFILNTLQDKGIPARQIVQIMNPALKDKGGRSKKDESSKSENEVIFNSNKRSLAEVGKK